MSIAYEGFATVILSVLLFGVETIAVTNTAVAIQILRNNNPGWVDLHFTGPLNAPDQVNHVHVTLPSGMIIAGKMLQDKRGGNAGWLRFELNKAG
jgi:hypothetical protein